MRQIIFLLIFIFYRPINGEDASEEEEKCIAVAAAAVSSTCNEDTLIQTLAEMEITNPESIVRLAVDNLDNICRNLYEHLDKFHKYYQKCKQITPEGGLYTTLITGVRTLHKRLCKSATFIREFELFYPCLHELRNDFDGCNGPMDWFEDNNETELCKAYKRITDCYYIKPAKVCGIDAARVLKELLTEIVDSIISVRCREVRSDPYVKDPMPASYLCGQAKNQPSLVEVITFYTFSRIYLI